MLKIMCTKISTIYADIACLSKHVSNVIMLCFISFVLRHISAYLGKSGSRYKGKKDKTAEFNSKHEQNPIVCVRM